MDRKPAEVLFKERKRSVLDASDTGNVPFYVLYSMQRSRQLRLLKHLVIYLCFRLRPLVSSILGLVFDLLPYPVQVAVWALRSEVGYRDEVVELS